MKRLFLFLSFFPIFIISCETYKQEEKPPNIILFFVDDMGWQDTSVPFWKKKNII